MGVCDVVAGVLVSMCSFFRILGGVQVHDIYLQCWVLLFGILYVCSAVCYSTHVALWMPIIASNLGRGLWVVFLGSLAGTYYAHTFSNHEIALYFFTYWFALVLGVVYVVFFVMGTFCGTHVYQPTALVNASHGGGDVGGSNGARTVTTSTKRTVRTTRPGKSTGRRLPPGWSQAIDERSGDIYYVHRSGVTQWDRP